MYDNQGGVAVAKTCPEALAAIIYAIAGIIFFFATPVLESIAISKALNARRMAKVVPEWGGEGMATAALGIGAVSLTVWFLALIYLLTSWT